MKRLAFLLAALLLAPALHAQTHRRALLIGIDDYSASHIAQPQRPAAPGREWIGLTGAVNDVHLLSAMLERVYGFERRDIRTLVNADATREAILSALDRELVAAAKGDVVFFYFAGHGSQVRNSRSDEPDGFDESLVPADSRLGAADIRDKELRARFNRILDRGARLTVVLDNCFSGSGARGPLVARGVARDRRDVADPVTGGPRPEDRGALVLSASQDYDSAFETHDAQGQPHGAFTWALARALRDARAGEPAAETFLRAQARLRAEMPFQAPVMAGTASARLAPFLGTRVDRRDDRVVVAVERVRADGTVVIEGGWANGLTAGSKLRPLGTPGPTLTITAMRALGQSEAHVDGERVPPSIRSGALLELAGWAAPPPAPLRVFVPHVPIAAAIARDGEAQAVEWTSDPRTADAALVTRVAHGRRTYAWRTPTSRSRWTGDVAVLRDALRRIRRIHAWLHLDSPPGAAPPYRLALVRERDGALVRDARVVGDERYTLTLLAPAAPRAAQRFVYVFTIDSDGRSTLLFPRSGSVENRLPLQRDTMPPRISLAPAGTFEAAPPYGTDVYVLLTSDEPLPNPSILEWDGIRGGSCVRPTTALETLLQLTMTDKRSVRVLTPTNWSIERVAIASIEPGRPGR